MRFDLDVAARTAARHCWVEARMYEVIGAWVPTTVETDIKLMLDRHSRHHAWRAREWWERLPVVADVERDLLVQSAEESPWAAPIQRAAGMTSTVSRLAAAYRVLLPRLCCGLALHRAQAGEVSDGSALRTLQIVLPDVAADWAEGESALEGLLAGPDTVGEAAEAARATEILFVG
jgi:hypothetical protein